MGKRRKKGLDRRAKGLILLAVIVVGVAGWLVYYNAQYKNLGTYSFAGMPYPKLPTDYTEVSSSTTNGNSDVGYLTSNSITQIKTDVMNICKSNKFALQKNSLSPGQTSAAVGPTFDVYDINCNNKDNSWLFEVVSAAALQYQPWKNNVPAAVLKSDLNGKYWVDVSSNGPPITSTRLDPESSPG